MKNWFWILLILMSAALACSLSPASTEETAEDPRAILRDSQPSIVLLTPHEGFEYALGTTILLHAEARDLGEGIVRIEFYDHFDEVISTVQADDPEGVESMSATATWIADEPQLVFLKARAFRADGTASETAEVPVRIVVMGEPLSAGEDQPTATTISLTQEPQSAAVTPQAGVTPSPEPTELLNVTLPATVAGTETLNIRQSPSTSAGIIRTARQGDTLNIVARNEAGDWYATPLENGTYGWVFGEFLDFGEADPSALPPATTQ